MKKFYKISILLLFTLSLFVMKDELKSQTDKIISHLRQGNKSEQQALINKKDEIEVPTQKAETPGPLIVSEVAPQKNETKNSSSGTLSQTEVNTPEKYVTGPNLNLTLNSSSVIEITNEYRKNENLSPLKENEKLKLSAQKKVEDMFANQYFEHTSPEGIGASGLAEQVGYTYILIGENLAVGSFRSNRSLVDAWMNSPGHRANILNKSYTEIGVAVGKGKYQGREVWMAVQHFGLPKSVCPTINESLKGIIGINQDKMTDMEKELTQRKEMIDNGAVFEGSSYYEQINKYNDMLENYYSLIKETKNLIDEYNQQVRDFNACLSNKT